MLVDWAAQKWLLSDYMYLARHLSATSMHIREEEVEESLAFAYPAGTAW